MQVRACKKLGLIRLTPGEALTCLAGELRVRKALHFATVWRMPLPTEGTRSRQSELVLQRAQGGNLWAASLGFPACWPQTMRPMRRSCPPLSVGTMTSYSHYCYWARGAISTQGSVILSPRGFGGSRLNWSIVVALRCRTLHLQSARSRLASINRRKS